jgi:hypothetical protein
VLASHTRRAQFWTKKSDPVRGHTRSAGTPLLSLAAAVILGSVRAEAADLVIWWDKPFYAQR